MSLAPCVADLVEDALTRSKPIQFLNDDGSVGASFCGLRRVTDSFIGVAQLQDALKQEVFLRQRA
jgi:hypothetical protein